MVTLLHVTAEWAEVLRIWEVPSSYLGAGTGYPELLLVFLTLSQQIMGHCLKDRDNRPTTSAGSVLQVQEQ